MDVMIIEGADNLERYQGGLWNCGENIFRVVAERAQKSRFITARSGVRMYS
jgi:hypothetical protein